MERAIEIVYDVIHGIVSVYRLGSTLYELEDVKAINRSFSWYVTSSGLE
jgi:hypothetical protein